jgi:transcriptional regulator with XRE-family HTH domain
LVYITFVSAEQFKKLREKKGYTQAEVARLLKVTVRTVSRWENGDRRVPHIAIMALDSLSGKKEKR